MHRSDIITCKDGTTLRKVGSAIQVELPSGEKRTIASMDKGHLLIRRKWKPEHHMQDGRIFFNWHLLRYTTCADVRVVISGLDIDVRTTPDQLLARCHCQHHKGAGFELQAGIMPEELRNIHKQPEPEQLTILGE